MNTSSPSRHPLFIGVIVALCAIVLAFSVGAVMAQVDTRLATFPAGTASNEAAFHAAKSEFLAERNTLSAELTTLLREGASAEEIETWQQQNAARIAEMRHHAEVMAAQRTRVSLRTKPAARIPANASKDMKEFLTARTAIQNDQQRMLKQMRTATPEEKEQAMLDWEQEHAGDMAALGKIAQKMGADSPPAMLLSSHSPKFTAHASPEFKASMNLHFTLMKEEAEIYASHRNSSAELRDQAIEQWRTQNSQRFAQAQQAVLQAADRLSNQHQESR